MRRGAIPDATRPIHTTGETTMPETTNSAAATCPVCHWELAEGATEVQVHDTTVRVCCEECAREVALSPTKYLAR